MNQRTFKKTVPFGIQIELLMMVEAIQTRTVPCTIMQARMRGAPAVMRVSAREVSDLGNEQRVPAVEISEVICLIADMHSEAVVWAQY